MLILFTAIYNLFHLRYFHKELLLNQTSTAPANANPIHSHKQGNSICRYFLQKAAIKPNKKLTRITSKMKTYLVKGPANLQRPPKPQLCRKWSCCWDLSSSQAIMFSMMAWTAARIVLSWHSDSTFVIFASWRTKQVFRNLGPRGNHNCCDWSQALCLQSKNSWDSLNCSIQKLKAEY